MRLCDLLRNIMDDFIIEIYENKEVVKKGNSKQLNEENKKNHSMYYKDLTIHYGKKKLKI